MILIDKLNQDIINHLIIMLVEVFQNKLFKFND